MKFLLLGHMGMLGHDLMQRLSMDHEVTGKDIDDFDIASLTACRDIIIESNPDVVINAAAYTNVDACETDREKSFAVNALGVKNIAIACQKTNIKIVHFSTDYVFEGKKKTPYVEEDIAIKSFNKVDLESDLSEVVSAKTKARPVKPSGLKGERLKVKSVPLEWLSNPEKDIKEYHIYRSSGTAVTENFTRIDKINKTTYVDSDLKDGQTYIYKIQAEDKDELLSDFSDIISMQTKTKPQSPEGLKDEIQDGKVKLNWIPGQEKDIVNYIVYEKKFFGLEKIVAVKETNFIENSPPKGKTKTYVITSIDKDGLESDASREIIITGK